MGGGAADRFEPGFDMAEAALELGIGAPQGRFRIDLEMTGEIGHGEEEVAIFLDRTLPAAVRTVMGGVPQLLALLGDLGEQTGEVVWL